MEKYSEKLLNHFHYTSHQGRLDLALPDVFTSKAGSIDNQDVLQLFLQINNNLIVQARFLAIGSVAVIGGAQWLCEFIEGKTIANAKHLSIHEILKSLALPSVKIHVAQLLLAALTQCLEADHHA